MTDGFVLLQMMGIYQHIWLGIYVEQNTIRPLGGKVFGTLTYPPKYHSSYGGYCTINYQQTKI
jgi:hypothetical protein